MARQGEVCGALVGGILVVGLVHGSDGPDDQAGKNAVRVKAGEFVQRFAALNGAIRCRDLIDLDLTSSEGVKKYYALNLQEERCNSVVRNAVQALLELMGEGEEI